MSEETSEAVSDFAAIMKPLVLYGLCIFVILRLANSCGEPDGFEVYDEADWLRDCAADVC